MSKSKAPNTRTMRATRSMYIPGIGDVKRGGTVEVTPKQWAADKNSLVEANQDPQDLDRSEPPLKEK